LRRHLEVRHRASAAAGRRIEGKPGYAVTNPEIVLAARELARGRKMSSRRIAEELERLSHVAAPASDSRRS
jgi:hypothetical protein